jgi:hypothetical protein
VERDLERLSETGELSVTMKEYSRNLSEIQERMSRRNRNDHWIGQRVRTWAKQVASESNTITVEHVPVGGNFLLGRSFWPMARDRYGKFVFSLFADYPRKLLLGMMSCSAGIRCLLAFTSKRVLTTWEEMLIQNSSARGKLPRGSAKSSHTCSPQNRPMRSSRQGR